MTEHTPAAVTAFCDALTEVADVMREATGERDLLPALLARTPQGGSPRSGKRTGGLAYRVHGMGAYFELPDGRSATSTSTVRPGPRCFDLWRLAQFPPSVDVSLSDEDAERALAAAVPAGLLRVVTPGWYSLGNDHPGGAA